MTTKEMMNNNMTPSQMAKATSNEAKQAFEARQAKIKTIAEKLAVSFQQAESLVKQEEARIAAGKRYRESEAYKKRLEQQKMVRALMKA